MALKQPDEIQHNNPSYSIADSEFVRGGGKVVTNLTELYALSSKIDQLKERVTKVWVISENRYYILVNIVNVGNSDGWKLEPIPGTGNGDMTKEVYDTNNNGKVDVAENSEKLGGVAANQFVQTNDSRLSDARPASDVSAWAKDPTKPTYNKSEIGLGNVDNTSDLNKPVSTAQQLAIDNAVIGLYDDRGNYDASSNVFPSSGGSGSSGAILKSDIWFISAAGTLGSKSVKQGDTVRARIDNPGQIEANWAVSTTGTDLSYVSQSEAEVGTENTKIMTALRVVQSFVYQIINLDFSSLLTTSKKILGAINENYTNIVESFSRWNDLASTGFVKFDSATGDCWSNSGSTFNLLKSGYGRIKGTKRTFQPQSVSFPTSYGFLFAKIDSSGTLVTGGSVDFDTEFPLFYLFTGVSGTYYVAWEAHNFSSPSELSKFLHKSIGVLITGSGGNVAVASTNTQVAISGAAELLDHGLTATIADTAGAGVTWIQDYLNASGQWALNTLSANLSPKYNLEGVPTNLDSGKFGVYRLYATKQDGNNNNARYLAIMDNTQYSNQNSAQSAINANTVAVATGALISVEVAQLGFAIVRADGVVMSTTVSKQTLTLQSASSSAATASGTSLIPFDGITATEVQTGLQQVNDNALSRELLITYYSTNGALSPRRYLNGAKAITFTGYKLMTGVTNFSVIIGSTTYTKANIANVVLAANTEMVINSLTLSAGYTDGNCSLLFK